MYKKLINTYLSDLILFTLICDKIFQIIILQQYTGATQKSLYHPETAIFWPSNNLKIKPSVLSLLFLNQFLFHIPSSLTLHNWMMTTYSYLMGVSTNSFTDSIFISLFNFFNNKDNNPEIGNRGAFQVDKPKWDRLQK